MEDNSLGDMVIYNPIWRGEFDYKLGHAGAGKQTTFIDIPKNPPYKKCTLSTTPVAGCSMFVVDYDQKNFRVYHENKKEGESEYVKVNQSFQGKKVDYELSFIEKYDYKVQDITFKPPRKPDCYQYELQYYDNKWHRQIMKQSTVLDQQQMIKNHTYKPPTNVKK